MNQFYTFEDIITTLISINKSMRRVGMREPAFRQQLSWYAWAEEYCTVHIDVGRQMGKTSYIIKHADTRDLVITATFNMKQYIQSATLNPTVLCVSEIMRRAVQSLPLFEIIYIDEPAYVFGLVKQRDLYQKLVKEQDQTFVLLGK